MISASASAADSAARLRELERRNLFVQRDALQPDALRCHPLFRDFLRRRHREFGLDVGQPLHRARQFVFGVRELLADLHFVVIVHDDLHTLGHDNQGEDGDDQIRLVTGGFGVLRHAWQLNCNNSCSPKPNRAGIGKT